jgi:hypothetical protein
MSKDKETYRAKAREMQQDRPQWNKVWWAGRQRGYGAIHRPSGQIIFSTDPEELIRMMDQVEAGARLDPWPWRWWLLAWPVRRADRAAC